MWFDFYITLFTLYVFYYYTVLYCTVASHTRYVLQCPEFGYFNFQNKDAQLKNIVWGVIIDGR